jgi:hypothetical protein
VRPADEARVRALESVLGAAEPSPFGDLQIHVIDRAMTMDQARAIDSEEGHHRLGPVESKTDVCIEVIEVAKG